MRNYPDKIDSKFRFVLLSAARAEQMMQGGRPKPEIAAQLEGRKLSRIAMDEVAGDLITWDYGPAPEPEVEAEGDEAAGDES